MSKEIIIKKFADAWKLYNTKYDWSRYKKRPIIIKAIQMDRNFLVKTPEGIIAGRKGDFLIQGIEKEVYPCRESIFLKTYKKVKK